MATYTSPYKSYGLSAGGRRWTFQNNYLNVPDEEAEAIESFPTFNVEFFRVSDEAHPKIAPEEQKTVRGPRGSRHMVAPSVPEGLVAREK